MRLAPDNRVSGRSGNFNISKHLKCRRSIRVSIQDLLKFSPGHPKPAPYPFRIVRAVGDRGIELLVFEQPIDSLAERLSARFYPVFGVVGQTGRHHVPKGRIKNTAPFLFRLVLSECMPTEQA